MHGSILDTIGNTPIIRLGNIEKMYNIDAHLYAKLEYFNPFGSIKDRSALQIIIDAENSSLIKSNAIIEATSGNLGIALAGISKTKGYKCKIVMPENMSESRKKLLITYGADLILTEKEKGMIGAIEKANELANQEGFYYCDQFNNTSSIKAHYNSTAKEIENEMNSEVDAIICGIGSGGTISGIGTYFKEKSKSIKIIGVEPNEYPHKIQGIGAGFIPDILKLDVIDEIIPISYLDAIDGCRTLINFASIFVGISSGAVFSTALQLCSQKRYRNQNIVMIFADGGERYA